MTVLYLASRSPRRSELLAQLGVSFELLDVEVAEFSRRDETPVAYVRRIATEKARAGAASRPQALPVLAADTEVVLDGRILGKPVDRNTAGQMLRALSGVTHQVITVVCVVSADNSLYLRCNENRVEFRLLTEKECTEYSHSEETMDKAGAYAIQGRAAAFVTRLEGSFSAVMGLPLTETTQLLRETGCIR